MYETAFQRPKTKFKKTSKTQKVIHVRLILCCKMYTCNIHQKRHAVRNQTLELALDGNQYELAHERNQYQD